MPASVNADKHMCEQALCSRTDYIQFTTRSSSLPPRQTGLASVGAGRSPQAFSIALSPRLLRSLPPPPLSCAAGSPLNKLTELLLTFLEPTILLLQDLVIGLIPAMPAYCPTFTGRHLWSHFAPSKCFSLCPPTPLPATSPHLLPPTCTSPSKRKNSIKRTSWHAVWSVFLLLLRTRPFQARPLHEAV